MMLLSNASYLVRYLLLIGVTLASLLLAPIARASDSWVKIPVSAAQCTAGAKLEKHSASVRISEFKIESELRVELLPAAQHDAIKRAIQSHPKAAYIGNGPIFRLNDHPNGFVKSEGKVLNALDCVDYKANSGNLGRNNSVFVRYHPRTRLSKTGGFESVWKLKVVATDELCRDLESKRATSDLADAEQIDFAIQSGPGVLMNGQNLLAGYNAATTFRSYIGVMKTGAPVIVEANGNIGSFCLGQYLLSKGVRDLLHRDSFVSDAAFRDPHGTFSGYPSENPNARAASLLIIAN